MSYDDIKHKTLAEIQGLTIEQLYLIFKQRYEEEQNDLWLKQMSKKND